MCEAPAAGDITLDDAAAQLRPLNAADPNFYPRLRLKWPGATDDELTAWQAVRHARRSVRGDVPVIDQVESEYRRRFPAGPDPDMLEGAVVAQR